jgi:dTMP kinase
MLIVFEGGEGCGKTTMAGMFVDYLQKEGRKKVVACRDPGGTIIGDRIREMLLDSKGDNLSPLTELLLYLASRQQLSDTIIRPALADGRVVVLDRYYFSTAIYQGIMGGLEREINMITPAIPAICPDFTFFLHVDPQVGLARTKQRVVGDVIDELRFEGKGIEYHCQVNSCYRIISENIEAERCTGIDVTSRKVDEVFKTVVNRFHAFLHGAGRYAEIFGETSDAAEAELQHI